MMQSLVVNALPCANIGFTNEKSASTMPVIVKALYSVDGEQEDIRRFLLSPRGRGAVFIRYDCFVALL